MSPDVSAVRRPGSAGRALAVVLLAVPALLAALAFPQSARAEPTEPSDWVYEFADFTATPATTDYDHRTVTLTGVLLRHPSYGGPVQPAAGEQVDLVQSAGSAPSDGGSASGDTGTDGQSMGTVTTDGSGRFELPDAQVDRRPDQAADPVPGPFTVTVGAVHRTDAQADPRTGTAGTGTVQTYLEITATPSTARLTVDYQLGPVSSTGRTVTAQGVFARDSPLGRQPVESAAVTVTYRTAGAPPLTWEVDTGPGGRFSVTFTATADGVAGTSVDWSADPYLDLAGSRGLTCQVAVPSATPSPTPSATVTTLPPPDLPADRATAVGPAPPSTAPSSPAAPPTTDEPKPVLPSDVPRTLAVTGGGTARATLLTAGSTMLAAGLLVMVVRRRIRASG